MNQRTVAVFCCSLAILALAVTCLHKYRADMESNLENLQAARQQVAQLKEDNARLSKLLATSDYARSMSVRDSRELLKLRAEVVQLRALKEKNNKPSTGGDLNEVKAVPPSSIPDPAQNIPKEAWAFAGYGTPANALESLMWAMRNGDVKSFIASLTPEAQESMAKLFAGMSDDQIAETLKNEIADLSALQLDQTESVSDTEQSFVLYSEETDNGTTKTRSEAVVTFQNIEGEWKSKGVF